MNASCMRLWNHPRNWWMVCCIRLIPSYPFTSHLFFRVPESLGWRVCKLIFLYNFVFYNFDLISIFIIYIYIYIRMCICDFVFYGFKLWIWVSIWVWVRLENKLWILMIFPYCFGYGFALCCVSFLTGVGNVFVVVLLYTVKQLYTRGTPLHECWSPHWR